MSKTHNTSEDHKAKNKQRLKNILRFLISIIAIFCLIKFGKVDIRVAFKYLLKVNPVYFTLAYTMYFITMLIAGFRFYFSSKALHFQKSYFQLVQLNFVGTFFNNFLPTTFGGDALRSYYLKRGSHISISKAVACIIYERYTGVVILFWLASVAFLLQDFGIISKSEWELPRQLVLFSHASSLVTIFLIPFLPQITNTLLGKTNWIYKKAVEPFLVYWHDVKLTVRILILSVCLQITVMLAHLLIALSLCIKIPLSYYLVFYPLTTIAGFLIPSLNGLGIREGSYIFFLKHVKVPTEQGLAFSICWLIVLLITSLIGSIIYMVGDFRKDKPVDIEQIN